MDSQDVARELREKDEADARADLQRTIDKFGLTGLDAAAAERIRYLESRASEIAKLLKDTAIKPDDREAILAKHPLLRTYYDAVEREQDALRDRSFGQLSRLVRGRATFAALRPADLVPDKIAKQEWEYYPRWGAVSPAVMRTYERLGNNLTPVKDIDETIGKLRGARRALDERLAAIVGHAPAK